MTEELKSHFLNLYQMVLSDTEIDPEELILLYRIGIEHNVSSDEINRLLICPNKSVIPSDTETKVKYLYDLARMAWSDGKLDDNEENTLKMLCRKFGFMENNIDAICEYLLHEAQNNTPVEEIINSIK